MFKKIAIVAGLAAFVSAAPAMADTDLLALSGKIDYQCDLTLSGQTANSLNLKNGEQNVGNFTVTCNDADGFKVVVDSTNNGKLTNGTFFVDYDWIVAAAAGEPTDLNYGYSAPDTTKTVVGFKAGYADGAVHSIKARPDTSKVLPGGVELTDTVLFTIDGTV